MNALVEHASLSAGTPSSSSSGLETDADVKKELPPSAEANPSLAPNDSTSHELSNLRLENQLLRNEVQSLNQEMAALIQRAAETQKGGEMLWC